MAPHSSGIRQGRVCLEDLFDLPWFFSSPSGLRFLPKVDGCLLQLQPYCSCREAGVSRLTGLEPGLRLCQRWVTLTRPSTPSTADQDRGILCQPSLVSICNANLYMSGLPKDMGQDMEQLFSQYSCIITSHIIVNQVTYAPGCLDPHPRGGGLPRCLGPQ
ncbi:uncharacterized protein ACIBXB_020931 [Morphnus guianensis]